MRATDAELLTFVFTFHIVDHILHADGELAALEIDWIVKLFPRQSLYARGLIDDDDALTERYARLLEEALQHLPERLNDDAKAVLLRTFFEGALADGQLEPREEQMIVYACQLLGIPTGRVHLGTTEAD